MTGVVLGPDDRGQAPADVPAGVTVVSPDAVPAREPVIEAAPDLFLSFNEAQLVGQGTLSHDDLTGIGTNVYVMGACCAEPGKPVDRDRLHGHHEPREDLRRARQGRAAQPGAEGPGRRREGVPGRQHRDGRVPEGRRRQGLRDRRLPASAFTEALGLTNEVADLPTAFAELNTAQALAMDPDIVFVNYVGDEQAAIADLTTALPDLAAVRENRVYRANENLVQGSGVGIIGALEAIATDVKTAGQ